MKTMVTEKKRYIQIPLLFALFLLLSACGSKGKNEIEDDNSNLSNNGRYNSPAYQAPNVSSQTAQKMQQLMTATACAQGSDGVATYTGKRLQQYVNYSISGNIEQDGNSSTIDHIGPLTAGSASNSGNEELYVGVSVFGDLLFVTKYSSGFNVSGYNYTISFCESTLQSYNPFNGQSTNIPLISDENQVIQLSNDSQTILDFQSCQGNGMIDQADLTAYFSANTQYNYSGVQGYNSNGNYLPMVTTFYPVSGCSNGYY